MDAHRGLRGVVIDNGSHTCKAGYAGENSPQTVIPCCVGKKNETAVMIGMVNKNSYIGDEAQRKRGILSLSYPIDRGRVVNWDDMETIWHHVFSNELKVAPEEHPVLLTEVPLNPKSNRELMAQIMFEKFRIPAIYIGIPAVLSYYASGRSSGMMFDSGEGVSYVVPIYEGYAIKHGIKRLDLAGTDLTINLENLLRESGNMLTSEYDKEIIRDIKEKVGYVSLQYENELQNPPAQKSYELPDGTKVFLGNERFRCPEILFQSSFNGKVCVGVHKLIHNSIQSCDVDVRRELYRNIIMNGGTTAIPGMSDRTRMELRKLVPLSVHIHVTSEKTGTFSAWQGGSILASSKTFMDRCVSKQMYDEIGDNIVHTNFF